MSEVPDLYPGEPASIRLMNTVWADRSGVHDALLTTDQLAAWWSLTGFSAAAPPTEEDLAQYRELRGALRRLAAQVTDDSRDHARRDEMTLGSALAVVNARLAQDPLTLRWEDDDALTLDWPAPSGGAVPGHLTALAREAATLLAAADSPLRACYGPGCVLYFARQHTRREWCSAGCGNRARVARHYRRARGSENATGPSVR